MNTYPDDKVLALVEAAKGAEWSEIAAANAAYDAAYAANAAANAAYAAADAREKMQIKILEYGITLLGGNNG